MDQLEKMQNFRDLRRTTDECRSNVVNAFDFLSKVSQTRLKFIVSRCLPYHILMS